MNKSKIDWCDMSFNPVTGCNHGCEYCYARRIAERFRRCHRDLHNKIEKRLAQLGIPEENVHELKNPCYFSGAIDPYPYGFEPTFHRYRLEEPAKLTKPRKIFVCSMADLFGNWVPDKWIEEVFKACHNADRHKYIFLTKNPKKIGDAIDCYESEERGFGLREGLWDDFWFGTTVTLRENITKADDLLTFSEGHKFLSLEPLFDEVDLSRYLKWPLCKYWKSSDEYPNKYHWKKQSLISKEWIGVEWVIIGAQTGPGAVPPKPKWVQQIIDQCRAADVPVFMKNNLKPYWNGEWIQEWPEGLR